MPFPSLDDLLAETFGYLTPGLIKYRMSYRSEKRLMGTWQGDGDKAQRILALFRDKGEGISYRARFSFLGEEENAGLTSQVDFFLGEAWPRPTIGLISSPEGMRVAVEDRPAKKTAVQLRRVGGAQLWYGEGVGVLFEAPLYGSEPAAVEDILWESCEGFLRERGAKRCFTTHHDPAFTKEGYRVLLARRGYELGEREGLGGAALCASKAL